MALPTISFRLLPRKQGCIGVPNLFGVAPLDGPKSPQQWETLLASWKKLIELLEDQEDNAILKEWLEKRAAGEVEMIPLDTLERERAHRCAG